MDDENFAILLVEDEEAHANLIEKNLKRVGIHYPIFRVEDGQKALAFIKKEKEYSHLPIQPSSLLILLDLNLPQLDGFQVLEKIRSLQETQHTLVFILSSTNNQKEVDRCYHLGCNLYLTKSTDYQTFSNMVTALGSILKTLKMPEK
jgi:CheY-like chemotaxis protein